MKAIPTFIFLFCFLQTCFCQLTGKLITAGGQPIPSTNVVLLKKADSSIVKTAVTNETGGFTMGGITAGGYTLRFSCVGYQTYNSPAFNITTSHLAKDFGTIVLNEEAKQLGAVVVRAEKPLYQQQPGGITVNVQNSILTAGSSVLEVLARSPGVVVNPRDNSISLNGKTGVMVMLDGKLLRMSAAQLAALLNGMSADDIETIELLNTPPAKYDADGNAGLINIVTKKNKRLGTNGSVSASGGYGYREKATASININHATKKLNLHAGYYYWHGRSYGGLFAWGTEDVGIIGGQTSFDYNGISTPFANYHGISTGADVHLSPSTTIGASVDADLGMDGNTADNHGAYVLPPDSALYFNSLLNSRTRSYNIMPSVYLQHDFNKTDNVRVEADYLAYKSNGTNNVQSSFVNSKGNEVATSDSLVSPQQQDLSNTLIQVSVLKADYAKQLSKKWKLEAGVKGTYTKNTAASGINNLVNNQWVGSGVGLASSLVTSESIAAAYSTLNVQVDTLTSLTAGARYEYSHNATEKVSNPLYAVDRKLGKLFPSVFVTRKLSNFSSLQFSYTNRISRPSYSDLASYVTYNDPVSVFTGNPALKPTITHNIRFGYNYHDYLFSLLLSRDVDPILGTQTATGPTKGLVYLMPENGDWQNSISLQAIIPVKINQWWNMSYSVVGGPRQYRVSFTPQPFEKTYVGYNANFTEDFKLPGDITMEVSGYYNSPAYYSNSRSNANAVANLGFKKQLKNNKGSFQLSVADIFRSQTYHSQLGLLTTDAFNSDVRVVYNGETTKFPIIKLSYSRSFGNNRLKTERHDSGASEEKDRVK